MVHVEVTVSTEILKYKKYHHRLNMTVVYYIKPKLCSYFFNTSLSSKYPPSHINRLSLVIHLVHRNLDQIGTSYKLVTYSK